MTQQFILSKLHVRPSAMPKFLAAAAMLSLSLSAHASNLIADGGFESAGGGNEYFAGHTIDGGTWNVAAGAVYIDSGDPYVYSGNNSLNLTGANPYTTDSISQTLSTLAGVSYTLNFWANSDSPNAFSLLINGTPLAGFPTSIVDNGFPGSTTHSSLFVDYSESFKASSTSTILTFSDISDPSLLNPDQSGSVVIDNVSVQVTPELDSITLLSTGFLGLSLLAFRKRVTHSIAG